MAISTRCAKCGKWTKVFPKGSNLSAFLFCAKCFPAVQVKVSQNGGVTLIKERQIHYG
jgi:hypothetical protein